MTAERKAEQRCGKCSHIHGFPLPRCGTHQRSGGYCYTLYCHPFVPLTESEPVHYATDSTTEDHVPAPSETPSPTTRPGSCCHAPEYDHHERRPDCDGAFDKYGMPCFGQHHPFVSETPSPEVGMRTPDWQREHDSLLENVVRICLDSRKVSPERQAAYLRDELLTMCDPLMLVTNRIRRRKGAIEMSNPTNPAHKHPTKWWSDHESRDCCKPCCGEESPNPDSDIARDLHKVGRCVFHLDAPDPTCSYCRVARLLDDALFCEGCEKPVTVRMEHYDWLANNGRFRCQPLVTNPKDAPESAGGVCQDVCGNCGDDARHGMREGDVRWNAGGDALCRACGAMRGAISSGACCANRTCDRCDDEAHDDFEEPTPCTKCGTVVELQEMATCYDCRMKSGVCEDCMDEHRAEEHDGIEAEDEESSHD